MACGYDLRKIDPRNGRQAAIPRIDQYMDYAGREPARHGAHRNQNAGRNENPGTEPGGYSATWGTDSADSLSDLAGSPALCRAAVPRFLSQRRMKPPGSG